MKKPWYTELMTFLIALAMGTMFCVTIYQLIPEALELLHTSEYTVACELRHRDCHFICGICHKSGVNFNGVHRHICRDNNSELFCSVLGLIFRQNIQRSLTLNRNENPWLRDQQLPFVNHIINDNCDSVCNATNNPFGPVPSGFCTLQVGGSKAYVWIMTTLFFFMIFFYDLQKLLQYLFSNEDNTHMATAPQD